ncbi:MAG: sigma-70 family RNA polymerase sigma factor [Chloroflexota bacterium]|nr:sigma-70 family RNA polymerase sigma factor [Chloroflexota bacterium]
MSEAGNVGAIETGPPDAEFVRRLQALDSGAWSELYDAHHKQLWRYALARTGRPELADDLVAQVFVEALESIGRFRPRGKPVLAWLYAIARNHVGKWARRHRRDSVAPAIDPGHEPMAGVVDALVLAEALGRLTDEQREIVSLRHYAGYSTAEIAVLLGKKEPAIYSAESRALASLRRHLSDSFGSSADLPGEIGGAAGIERVEGG